MHKIINTDNSPKAVGPYSQAILAHHGQLLFISGQIPLVPDTLELVSDNVQEQTKQVLKNLDAVLAEAGAKKEQVVRATVFIKNMDDFALINAEYEKYFAGHKPARACVEVARLPKNVLVEIDAIAII